MRACPKPATPQEPPVWVRNISTTTQLVDTASTPMLLKAVGAHRIDPTLLITHRFKFDDTLAAYDTFSHVATSKVLIEV